MQALAEGQTVTDGFTATSLNGTASQVVTVTITGTNDTPAVSAVKLARIQLADATPPRRLSGGAVR